MYFVKTVERLKNLLGESFPHAAEVDVTDRTGTGDHFHVLVVDSGFTDLTLLEQHKAVNEALSSAFEDGTIHELRITTRSTA